eukprot:1901481-Pyramimonas_sp.AAC.1
MPPALCTYPKYIPGMIVPPVSAVRNLDSGGGVHDVRETQKEEAALQARVQSVVPNKTSLPQ